MADLANILCAPPLDGVVTKKSSSRTRLREQAGKMAVDDARASLTDQEVTKNVVAQKIGPGDLIQLPPVFTYDAK